ncbi:hypothetical protein OTU49_013394, partial [Cherax quadricarinatus]
TQAPVHNSLTHAPVSPGCRRLLLPLPPLRYLLLPPLRHLLLPPPLWYLLLGDTGLWLTRICCTKLTPSLTSHTQHQPHTTPATHNTSHTQHQPLLHHETHAADNAAADAVSAADTGCSTAFLETIRKSRLRTQKKPL